MTGLYNDIEIGDTHGTQGRTITEADVVNFAGVSGDFSHIHTDAEHMQSSAFGERLAHGVLVFAVSRGLIWQSRDGRYREASVAFYGIDGLRFVAPVFFGDTISASVEISEKRSREHPVAEGVVRHDVTVENQDDETVQVYESLLLMQ